MAGWKREDVAGMPLYVSTTLAWLPGVVQGFSTRNGGVSKAPYDSLNLSFEVGDDPIAVEENRSRFARQIGASVPQLVFAEQVHGNKIGIVDSPSIQPLPGVDALITNVPGIILTLLYADCVPIYIVEPIKKVAALIHCGRRGAASNIVRETADVLKSAFDVRVGSCFVALGPSISGQNYTVGTDVVDQFRDTYLAGATTPTMPKQEFIPLFELHLRVIIFSQLIACGFKPSSIVVSEEDTYSLSKDFFSHRRENEKEAKTGRMAAVLGFREQN